MKRYSILFVAGLALMAACQQPAEESFVQEPAEEPAVFEAYASSRIGTRSHFDDADEGTSKEGTLYWDETDKVGVMSIFWMDINNFDAPPFSSGWTAKFDAHVDGLGVGYDNNTYIGVPLTKYFQSDLATVEGDPEDANLARLYTTKPMSQWLMNIDEMVNIGLYDFAMIYPMSTAPVGLALCKDSSGDVIFGVPLRVEPEQLVSKKFGHYQICADSGIDAIRLFSGNLGCYTSEDLLHGTKIEFDDVNPLTSLLEFDIKSDSDTPVQISYLKIRTDDVPLAGDTYFASEGQSAFLIYSQWGEDGKSTSKEITLRFPEGTEITSSYSDENYHAVVFPSYKAGVETVYNDGSVIGSAHCEYVQEYGGETLYFEAYDASDNLVLTAQKTIPENGFQARRRYKFSLDMTTGAPANDLLLPGEFSVSDLLQVNFTRGNLLYDNGSWMIHENQWDHIYTADATVTLDANSTFDLFGWATAGVKNPAGDYGADAYHVDYHPWDYEYTDPNYGPASIEGLTSWRGLDCEPYCEWGKNPELVSSLMDGLRTLSEDEWLYLLNTRTTASITGCSVTNPRYLFATVGGVNGLLILADGFGTDYAGTESSLFANCNTGAEFTVIDDAALPDIVAAGAAFLPMAGFRIGIDVDMDESWYWSSTSHDLVEARPLTIEPGYFGTTRANRASGAAVRLVKDAEAGIPANYNANAGSYTDDNSWN